MEPEEVKDDKVLKKITFKSYLDRNITTEEGAKLLKISKSKFVELYDEWAGVDEL